MDYYVQLEVVSLIKSICACLICMTAFGGVATAILLYRIVKRSIDERVKELVAALEKVSVEKTDEVK